MPTGATDYRKYLDPHVLAKISGLALRARMIVEGFFTGMHRSPHRGLSIEFADHRPYTQGDDLRHIDWKVYGKTDKYFIKEYEQETNLDLMLAVDASASMAYRSDGAPLSKYEYATALAAALAYLGLQQRDAIGLARFDERITDFIRPTNYAHHWQTLVDELEREPCTGQTDLGHALQELAERLPHRMVVVLISDCFADVESILRGLQRLNHRRHEVLVCQVLDPAERTFPFKGPTVFRGLETGERIQTEPGGLRERYLQLLADFQAELGRGCRAMRIDYTSFDTAQTLGNALSSYLAVRSARIRQRSSRVMSRG
jgi:uncharacterized protein (DUF58 family)